MKTVPESRHQQRTKRVQQLFSFSFDPTQNEGIEEIIAHLPEIDAQLQLFAKERPLNQIGKLDLAILRQGVFELIYEKQVKNIVIDEAIEIAKSHGADSSAKFVNAILHNIAITIL